MAYQVALLENTLPRVVRILNANPGAWSESVSGKIGAFPDDDEILAANLEADSIIATQGYFPSVNQTLSSPFLLTSPSLQNGSPVPHIRGQKPSYVEYSLNNADWKRAVEVNHVDDLTSAINLEAIAPAGTFAHLFKFERGLLFTTAPYLRITYPEYTRTDALQCAMNDESLIIFTTVRLLAKHASPVDFAYFIKESERGIMQLVVDGKYTEEA